MADLRDPLQRREYPAGAPDIRIGVHALRNVVSARDSTLSHKYTPCCVKLLSCATTEKAATALRQASAEHAMQMSLGPPGQEAETPSRLCDAGTRRSSHEFRPGPGPKAYESAIRSERGCSIGAVRRYSEAETCMELNGSACAGLTEKQKYDWI